MIFWTQTFLELIGVVRETRTTAEVEATSWSDGLRLTISYCQVSTAIVIPIVPIVPIAIGIGIGTGRSDDYLVNPAPHQPVAFQEVFYVHQFVAATSRSTNLFALQVDYGFPAR